MEQVKEANTPMETSTKTDMMGELNFFGLQIKQTRDGIFVIQSKYIKDLIKIFEME
jgi:hypothetical protein